ncbi:GNAT family N-acetyltransferase [Microbacterium sp. NPDC096154]|uniref:GNAT family N-acetyltransferase n=1 Tax=Microbacterium sp. NPDC096154 TaxID=3155549 RepID=UPI00331728A8
MIALVLPSRERHESWTEAIREFDGATLHGFSTFGFEGDDLSDPQVFERWLAKERRQRTEAIGGFVPATVWWIVDDRSPDVVLGSLHLRHELNAALLDDGGHIGYGVRPTARGRGVATAALQLGLEQARSHGIDRVLLICDSTNEASRRIILAAGGELEDIRGGSERYWIGLSE